MTDGPADSKSLLGQRAFWSFLLITLVAPLIVGVLVFVAGIVAGLVGRGPASLLALDRPGQIAWSAQQAIGAYVWSAIPAAVAAAILAWFMLSRNRTNWLVCATIGAVVATVFAELSGGLIAQHIAPIAFIGAIVGVAMSGLLKRIGITR